MIIFSQDVHISMSGNKVIITNTNGDSLVTFDRVGTQLQLTGSAKIIGSSAEYTSTIRLNEIAMTTYGLAKPPLEIGAVENSTIVIGGVQSKVGVGNLNPQHTLDVAGDIHASETVRTETFHVGAQSKIVADDTIGGGGIIKFLNGLDTPQEIHANSMCLGADGNYRLISDDNGFRIVDSLGYLADIKVREMSMGTSDIKMSLSSETGNIYFDKGLDIMGGYSSLSYGSLTEGLPPVFNFRGPSVNSGIYFLDSSPDIMRVAIGGIQHTTFDSTGLTASGIITASSFAGDGSNLTNVSVSGISNVGGLQTALDGLIVSGIDAVPGLQFALDTKVDLENMGNVSITGDLNIRGTLSAEEYIFPMYWSQKSELSNVSTSFGTAVAVSIARIAVTNPGASQVLIYNKDTKFLIQTISVPVGYDIDMSLDGTRLAISVPTGSGKVDMFQWNGQEYILEQSFLSPPDMNGTGMRLRMNTNGDSFVVGYPNHNHVTSSQTNPIIKTNVGFTQSLGPAAPPSEWELTHYTTEPSALLEWRSVAWSPKLKMFAAVASTVSVQQNIMTSTDGISWTTVGVVGIDVPAFWDIIWSPEREMFVAVAFDGLKRVAVSTDGVTWNTMGPTEGVPPSAWRSITWSPERGIFVAVADVGDINQRVMTWTGLTEEAWDVMDGTKGVLTHPWLSVTWSSERGIFVAVAHSGDNPVMTWTGNSNDNWIGMGSNKGVLFNGWHGITWSPELGLFVAVAYSGIQRVMTWTGLDVDTWTGRGEVDGVPESVWISVTWSREWNIFIAVAPSGTTDELIMTSSDGITWTGRTVPLNGPWFNITYSPELDVFVAVSTGLSSRTMTIRPNLSAWKPNLHGRPELVTSNVPLEDWVAVAWAPELKRFVAVSDIGTNRVMTSSDGFNWTPRQGHGSAYQSIVWSPERGIFVAVAYDGIDLVMTSHDGITWKAMGAESGVEFGGWYGVTWSPERGIFVAVSNWEDFRAPNGVVMTWSGLPGDKWEQVKMTIDDSGIGCYSVTWSPERGIFLATSAYTNDIFTWSGIKGDVWVTRPIPGLTSISFLTGSAWSSELGRFVFVSQDNRVFTWSGLSGDPITNINTINTMNSWHSVTWCKEWGLFVAISSTGTRRIMTSSDGEIWKTYEADQLNPWHGITFAPELDLCVAVGWGGMNRVLPMKNFASPANGVMTNTPSVGWSVGGFVPTNLASSPIDVNAPIWKFRGIGNIQGPWVQVTLGEAQLVKHYRIWRNMNTTNKNTFPTKWRLLARLGTYRDWTTISTIDDPNSFANKAPFVDVPMTLNENVYDTYALVIEAVGENTSYVRIGELELFASDEIPYRSYPTIPLTSASTNVVATSGTTAWSAFDNDTTTAWKTADGMYDVHGKPFAGAPRVIANGQRGEFSIVELDDNVKPTALVIQGAINRPVREQVRKVAIYATDDPNVDNKTLVDFWKIETNNTTTGDTTVWRSIAWSPQLKLFVAIASSKIMTSANGEIWTDRIIGTAEYKSVIWSPERSMFIAVAYDGVNRVSTSYDGIHWESYEEIPSWLQQVVLTEASSGYGSRVAISQTRFAVSNSATSQIFIYSRETKNLIQTLSIQTSDIDMSNDGLRLTVTAPTTGDVIVYSWNNVDSVYIIEQTLSEVGDINGENMTVRISSVGDMLIVGFPMVDVVDGGFGIAFTYSLVDSIWTKQDTTSDTNALNITSNNLGRSVDINNDGTVQVIGTPNDGQFGAGLGSLTILRNATAKISVHPTPTVDGLGLEVSVNPLGTFIASAGTSDIKIIQWSGTEWVNYQDIAKTGIPRFADDTTLLIGIPTATVSTVAGVGKIETWKLVNSVWTYDDELDIVPDQLIMNGNFGRSVAGVSNAIVSGGDGTSYEFIFDTIDRSAYGQFNDVAWSPERSIFVGVGLNKILTSSDGKTWLDTVTDMNGNEWSSVTWSPERGIFTAVARTGTNRAVYWSGNPEDPWTSAGIVQDNAWSDVTWSPELGMFVAVSTDGTDRLMTWSGSSLDTWIPRGTLDGVSDTSEWTSVAWSREWGVILAVARTGIESRAMWSMDGISFTDLSVTLNEWNSVTYASELGKFVAVSGDGAERTISVAMERRPLRHGWKHLATIDDTNLTRPLDAGVGDWNTYIPSTIQYPWNDVIWCDHLQKFVAVATDAVTTSMDGKQWTNPINITGTWNAVTWSRDRGIFVAVGDNVIMTSRTGMTWTKTTTVPTNNWKSITWSPERGMFVAVATGGVMTWTGNTLDPWDTTTVVANNWESIAWSPERGIFVAVSSTGLNRVMTWTGNTLDPWVEMTVTENEWKDIIWSPEINMFVVVAATGLQRVLTWSGLTQDAWSIHDGSSSAQWSSVEWSRDVGLFIAVGNAGTGQHQRAMTSPDGIQWTPRTVPEENPWSSIAYAPELNRFVAVANGGTANRAMTWESGSGLDRIGTKVAHMIDSPPDASYKFYAIQILEVAHGGRSASIGDIKIKDSLWEMQVSGSGVSYNYTLTNNTWSLTSKLEPEYKIPELNLGSSVDISDSVIVIGIPKDQMFGTGTGALKIRRNNISSFIHPSPMIDGLGREVSISPSGEYICASGLTDTKIIRWDGTNWVQHQNLGMAGNLIRFVDNETLVVGKPSETVNYVAGAGKVELWKLIDSSIWVYREDILPNIPLENNEFGRFIACISEVIVSAGKGKVYEHRFVNIMTDNTNVSGVSASSFVQSTSYGSSTTPNFYGPGTNSGMFFSGNTNIEFAVSGIRKGYFDTNGLVISGRIHSQDDITVFSDSRLKKDIKLIKDALVKTKLLNGVTFQKINDDSSRRYTGLIAQDVESVLPEAVWEDNNYKSLAYGNLMGLIVESIKELSQKVDAIAEKMGEKL